MDFFHFMTLSETVHKQNYAIAIYHISLPKEVDVLKKGGSPCSGADH